MRAILIAAFLATVIPACGGSETPTNPTEANANAKSKKAKSKAEAKKVANAYHTIYFSPKAGMDDEKVIKAFKKFRKLAVKNDYAKKRDFTLGKLSTPKKDAEAAAKITRKARGFKWALVVRLDGEQGLKKFLNKSKADFKEAGLMDIFSSPDKVISFSYVDNKERSVPEKKGDADKDKSYAYHTAAFSVKRGKKKEAIAAIKAFREAAVKAGYVGSKADFTFAKLGGDEKAGKGKGKGKKGKGKGKNKAKNGADKKLGPLETLRTQTGDYDIAITVRFKGKRGLKKFLDESGKDIKKAGLKDLMAEEPKMLAFDITDSFDDAEKGKAKGKGKGGGAGKAGKGGGHGAGAGKAGKGGGHGAGAGAGKAGKGGKGKGKGKKKG